ncbi:hypothetical protein MTR67_004598 [Solanum verrucosum]|uniref:Uncharacterized protein n=1 Tax=Solanum verrucosum TaxID=315347 RepID=A0AAF0TBH8_SOLVR|nr:hypothetical protein MTR67_004598 [Solanum verrucosum]
MSAESFQLLRAPILSSNNLKLNRCSIGPIAAWLDCLFPHLLYGLHINRTNLTLRRHDALLDNEKPVDGAEVPNPAIGDVSTALVVEAEEVGAGNVRDKPVPLVVEEAPVAAAVVEMLVGVVTVENKGDEEIENPVLAGFETGALEEAAEAVTELPPFATENDKAVEAEKGDGDGEAVAGMEKENEGAGDAALGVGVDNENAGPDAAELEVKNENAGEDTAELVDAAASENPGAEDTEVVVEVLNNENAGAEEAELAGEAPGKENTDEEEKELAAAELANESPGAVEDDPKGEDDAEEEDPNRDEENGVVLALVAAFPVEAVVDDKNGEEPNKPMPELEPAAELDPNKPGEGVPEDTNSEDPKGDEFAAALAEFTPNNGEPLADVVDPKRFVVIPDPEDDPNRFEVAPEPEEDPNRVGWGLEPEAALDENPNDGVEAPVLEPKPKEGAEEAEVVDVPKPKEGAEEAEVVDVPKPKEGAEEVGLGLGLGFEKGEGNGEEPEADDVVAVTEGVVEKDGFEEKEKSEEEEENEKPVDIATGATAARVLLSCSKFTAGAGE